MFLKRIELEGFKSFADRTVVQVQRGLTGIVGPNGCGKSNVVDALLWVMGERSAKSLRADQMDDVIFKGAEGRAPAPYAMVEIILADDAGDIVEPGGEVAIGRRLFRSGEAEYLLNGRKVKRKEVRDVLMDTGLGVRSYMVLAQGKIDAVLSANPAERRSVFEEAAGISRYKARKHEAELKLNRVAQDLARVEDVYEEVQRAVRSLKYQAGKAKNFLRLRDEYREKRITLSWADSARLQQEEDQLQARAAELEGRVAELRKERENAEQRLQELEKESAALREHYDVLRATAAEAKEKAAALEERVRGQEARAHELELRRAREAERLDGLTQEDRARRAEDEGLAGTQAERAAELEAATARLAAAQAAFDACRETSRALRGELEELRQGVLDALAERTRHNNLAATAAHDRSEAEGALRALERRTQEGAQERERLVGELDEARRALESAGVRVGEDEDRARQLVTRRDALREERDGSRAVADEARREAEAARTRLQALTAVDQDFEGVPDHVRELLHGEGAPGLLLDGVRVPAPWDRLVEDLLGRMQHGVWVADREAAATLPAGTFDVFFPAPSPVAAGEVDAAPLRSLVEGEAAKCAALCARLGEVYCVDDAARARELAEAHPSALFLSRDGELHGAGYARVGMTAGGDAAEGILARRNARELARETLERGERVQTEAGERAQRAGEELEQVRAELQTLDGRLREAVAERDRAQSRVQHLERRADALREEDRALADELASAEEKRTAARAAEEEASAQRDAAEARRTELNTRLEASETTAQQREEEMEAASAVLQEARLAEESVRQQLAHVQERIAAHQKLHERDRQEGERIRQELDELGRRAEELRAEAEASRGTMRGLLSERGELEERLEQARVQHERARDAFEQARFGAQGGEGRLESLLGERQELALALQRVQMQRGELVRAVTEEFQQPLEDLVRGAALEGEPPVDEPLEELRVTVGKLRGQLDAIGSVNLDAVEELAEREERATFLGQERQDLIDARTNLEQTIEDLDARCRVRFEETFHAVQDQFESIFRRLFRGGRADIALEADVDPLTAGIEISVRPPGKELRSIKLLSGGERTLTALALLLAVFRSRPSPFCLLDEVDAALDDANVGRFLDVLEDFVSGTQFMVVTHNKLTMARCERLFGVTMRKAGVSLVVGVELADLPEDIKPVEGGVPPAAERLAALTPADRGVPQPAAVEAEREAGA